MPLRNPKSTKSVPNGLWTKCRKCEHIIFNKELEKNLKICPKCGYYFTLSAKERLDLLLDPGSFQELFGEILPHDPLKFVDLQPYETRLAISTKKSGQKEAVVTGTGKIEKMPVAVAVLEFEFMGGSMGSVVGEKIARLVDHAKEKDLALVIVSASGGARMQESILSLMQMAKTSVAIGYYQKGTKPYISVLTHPTSGGVTASFAMLGDLIIAEKGALIAFAGPRVIEQTIKIQLPEGFQSAEFCMKHGMVDLIFERKNMKETIAKLLKFFVPDALQEPARKT